MYLNKYYIAILILMVLFSCHTNKGSKYGMIIHNCKYKSQKKQLIDLLNYYQMNKENTIDKYGYISFFSENNKHNAYKDHVTIDDSITNVFEVINITSKKNNYEKVGNKLRKKTIYFIDIKPILSNVNYPNHIRILSIDDVKFNYDKIKIGNKYKMTICFYFNNDCCISKSDDNIIYIVRKPNEFKYSFMLKNIWVVYSDIHSYNMCFSHNLKGLYYIPPDSTQLKNNSSTYKTNQKDVSTPYRFSAKEKDLETGFSYFGQRYYADWMGVWLSVDPMSDKYPSMSPYMYCAGNPVRLVDPNGMEVEHNSFSDKIRTTILRVFSSTFRNQYRELKKSEETYIFKSINDKKTSSNFGTDGNKLYINYRTDRNKNDGSGWIGNIKHEGEHAVQFEYGEIGFNNKGRLNADGTSNWNNSAVNFDLNDEYNARDVEYSGFTLSSNPTKNVRNSWLYGINPETNKQFTKE